MRLIDAAFIVLLVGPLGSTEVASDDGSIGCLFYGELCKGKSEKCFDDNAFGRCISLREARNADFFRYRLDADSLHLLKRELNRLISLGYRWTQPYTQCILKTVLFAIRYHKNFNENDCNVFAESVAYFPENAERLDPKTIGQVQFTPSVVDPHAEFADEIYFPVLEKEGGLKDIVIPLGGARSRVDGNYDPDLRRSFLLKEINKKKRGKYDDEGDNLEILARMAAADEEVTPDNYYAYLSETPRTKEVVETLKDDGDFVEKLRSDDDAEDGFQYGSLLDNIFNSDRNILKSFSRNYNTPEKFRDGHETKDEIVYPKSNSPVRPNQPFRPFYSPDERQFAYDTFDVRKNDEEGKHEDSQKGVFTEGGVVYLKDDNRGDESHTFDELVNAYGNWGFKRPERLDVKKPGPLLGSLNQGFEKTKANEKEVGSKNDRTKPAEESQSKTLMTQPEKKKGGSPMESPSLRRQTTTVQPLREKDVLLGDNSEFAYMKLKNRVNTWQEGSRIVRKIEDVLNLKQNTFTNIRVDQNDVRFKVEPNRLNLNASEVVRRIEALKDSIQRATGIEVVSTGVGNQNNLPPSMSLLGEDERQLWFVSFLLCGLIAAVAIVGAVVFVIKRHPHSIDKLEDLAQMDSEASKDYQELCRARMASKTAQEKPEGNIGGHRVTNLTKEVEAMNNSPSSRSSTSSWSEEPALTNMDISTGHMVLSYMEDHLKNKDRLEQEWIALCGYEAEPCATTIALKGGNAKKNRYNDMLPYDHARVVLNELSNVTGSDYINASTITDHDPRNPAYIASQGPLEQTTADFWQMIWEQGSVVMVMLTRLTENGTAMCHRYWPEEGSELYHIYEVHLVSEHIWCDDYLVRSFYLKNIKTSETRTVTQFHFLSWPENGVPLSTKALLEFRRKVNKSYRGRSCPVVVHCSDGVGRTGTYCLIDMVLNRMAKGAKEIDIAATLEHIRDQRPLMVKTKQQFEFVLMAVAEEVHAILKALPATLNHSPPPVVKEKE